MGMEGDQTKLVSRGSPGFCSRHMAVTIRAAGVAGWRAVTIKTAGLASWTHARGQTRAWPEVTSEWKATGLASWQTYADQTKR